MSPDELDAIERPPITAMAGKPLSTAAPRYPAGATATTVAGTTG